MRRRVLLAAAAGCAIAAVALSLALGGSGGAEGRIGISTHFRFAGEAPRDGLRQIRDSGVTWIREDFPWDAIEPEPGRWDWEATDALMAAAAQEDVRVLAILAYSASWAAPGVHFPPDDDAAYARYAGAVAARYGPGGDFWRARQDLPERPLAAVEIWNEPWGHFFWEPDPDPARYAELASAATEAVRAAAPGVQVLLPGDLLQVRNDGDPRPWLAALLDAAPDLARGADGFTVHPYPSPRDLGPDEDPSDPRYGFGRVTTIRDLLRSRDIDAPLWITELGWTTAPGVDDAVTEEEQADHVARALDRALDDWDGFVERIFIYSWDRSTGTPGDSEGNYGLRRADGTFKPAWDEITARAG